MYAKTFEFNGLLASNLNLYIMNFDGNTDGAIDTGGEVTFNTSKPGSSDMWYMHSSTVENPLTFTFQIGKYDCDNDIEETISREEYAFIMSWLQRRDGYKWLRFIQDGYTDTYFNCQLNVKPIEWGGKKVGLEVTGLCNAPYGFSPEQTYTATLLPSVAFSLYNDSDKEGELLFDKVVIKPTANCDIEIINDLDSQYCPDKDYSTIIKNCSSAETITIENRQIYSTVDSHDLGNDFNFLYPRLIYMYDYNNLIPYRRNTYTVKSGSFEITLTYRTVRMVSA